jgi:hypothetical protein
MVNHLVEVRAQRANLVGTLGKTDLCRPVTLAGAGDGLPQFRERTMHQDHQNHQHDQNQAQNH